MRGDAGESGFRLKFKLNKTRRAASGAPSPAAKLLLASYPASRGQQRCAGGLA